MAYTVQIKRKVGKRIQPEWLTRETAAEAKAAAQAAMGTDGVSWVIKDDKGFFVARGYGPAQEIGPTLGLGLSL